MVWGMSVTGWCWMPELKEKPPSGDEMGFTGGRILCGLVLLGVCAAKLWNRDDQQSQRPAEPSAAPVVSQTPQDSAEESIPVEDTESAGAEISDYQVAVTENAVYFIDPVWGCSHLTRSRRQLPRSCQMGSAA